MAPPAANPTAVGWYRSSRIKTAEGQPSGVLVFTLEVTSEIARKSIAELKEKFLQKLFNERVALYMINC